MRIKIKLVKLFLLSLFLFSSLTISTTNVFAVNSNGHWEVLSPINEARTAHGIAKLNNGKVLITGGVDPANPNYFLKSTEIYDPATKVFTQAGNLNENRQLAVENTTVTFSDGRVLIVGGGTAELFDPISETWSYAAPPNTPRYHTALAPLPGDKALVFTGESTPGRASWVAATEIYDPTTNTWTPSGSMHIARFLDYDFGILPDGRIIAIGGENQTVPNNNRGLDSAEIYNPTTGKWTLTSQMPFRYTQGAVTVLNDGRVLVTGGLINANPLTFKNAAAIYNPNNDTWTQVTNMPNDRSNHYDYVLDDGRVLIFGGFNSDNGNYNLETSTFIYDPVTNSWSLGPEMPGWFRQGKKIRLDNGDLLLTGSEFNGAYNYVYLFTNGNNKYLNVPYFNQNDENWGSLEYDSASKWKPKVNDTSISAWGCALSSAAMILKYHGYNFLPDGTEINPSSLNDWFKEQKDNYIRNGLVNWTAINRLSREAKEINEISSFEALDYTRIENNDRDTLSSYIENNIPVILEIQTGEDSSHFVVATGIDGDTITINDPLGTNTTLEAYNNEFRSMRVLEPTSTDLSAIQIVVNDNVDVEVNKKKGLALGSQYKHLPIQNDNGEGKSGESVNIFYLSDPETDSYTATLSSTEIQKYTVDVYLYDQFGDVKIKSFGGVLTGNSNDEINIYFDKDNVENSKINRKRALGLDFLDISNLLMN